MSYALFYKSINGDRVYDDTSFEHWLKKFFTSGVFLNDLQVTANSDMSVNVGTGYVNADGKVKNFEAETTLHIENAGATYPRIDSIVLERNDTERDILLKVVKGGYSSEPVAHVPVRQDGVYQLVIAQILVGAGAVKITQADITDTRSKTELCGIVSGAVDQIDFSQVQAQFDAWFANVKERLSGDDLGELLNRLDQMVPVDNLLSTAADLPLSANQGRELNEKFGDCVFTTESDGVYVTYKQNGSNVKKKLGSEGNAAVSDVLSGKTFSNADGIGLTGTMADKTATAAVSATASLDSTNKRLKMTVPAVGKYGTNNYLYSAFSTVASLIGLTAAKLAKGNTVLGVTGTYKPTLTLVQTRGSNRDNETLTFSATGISGYQNLTKDDFIVIVNSISSYSWSAPNTTISCSPKISSYDATTGTITVSGLRNSQVDTTRDWHLYVYVSNLSVYVLS